MRGQRWGAKSFVSRTMSSGLCAGAGARTGRGQGLTAILGKTTGIEGKTGLGEQWGSPGSPHPGEKPHRGQRCIPASQGTYPGSLGELATGLDLCTDTQTRPCVFKGTPEGRTPQSWGMGGMRGPVGVPRGRGGCPVPLPSGGDAGSVAIPGLGFHSRRLPLPEL